MGEGDVLPLTLAASMIAVTGTVSIAAVMGVWISRLRMQEAQEWRRS